MKTIVYATDYSKNAIAALKYAHGLAVQMKARLVVTHVFGYPVIVGMEGLDAPFPHSEKASRRHHRQLLETFCAAHLVLEPGSTEMRVEPVIEKSAVQGIMSKANDWHAEFIVVGVRGESRVQELVQGSTTKQLIERAPCPVLAIPSNVVYKPLETIVYASDFEEEDIFAIRKLITLAASFQALVKVVHVSAKKEDDGEGHLEWFKEMLAQKVSYERLGYELLFSDAIFESLNSYIEEINADLLVMLEREKRGLSRKWFHRDLVKRMESLGKIPLLSFRENNHHCLYS